MNPIPRTKRRDPDREAGCRSQDQLNARLRRAFGGRQAAQGAGLRAGPRARAADPDQLQLAAVRRRPVGAERQARPFRLHDQDARARRRGGRDAQAARRDAARTRPPRPGCSTARSPPTRSASAWSRTPAPTSRAWTPARSPRPCSAGSRRTSCPTSMPPNISRWCARRPGSPSTCCRRCRTPSSPATPPAGSTAASR